VTAVRAESSKLKAQRKIEPAVAFQLSASSFELRDDIGLRYVPPWQEIEERRENRTVCFSRGYARPYDFYLGALQAFKAFHWEKPCSDD